MGAVVECWVLVCWCVGVLRMDCSLGRGNREALGRYKDLHLYISTLTHRTFPSRKIYIYIRNARYTERSRSVRFGPSLPYMRLLLVLRHPEHVRRIAGRRRGHSSSRGGRRRRRLGGCGHVAAVAAPAGADSVSGAAAAGYADQRTRLAHSRCRLHDGRHCLRPDCRRCAGGAGGGRLF